MHFYGQPQAVAGHTAHQSLDIAFGRTDPIATWARDEAEAASIRAQARFYKQLEHHYDSPELWSAAMSEHRSVLRAIVGHDPAGARAAMQRHLNQAYKRFSKGWDTLQ